MSYAINKRLKKTNERPGILLVDGGKMQLNSVNKHLKNKNILLAIEKVLTEKANRNCFLNQWTRIMEKFTNIKFTN